MTHKFDLQLFAEGAPDSNGSGAESQGFSLSKEKLSPEATDEVMNAEKPQGETSSGASRHLPLVSKGKACTSAPNAGEGDNFQSSAEPTPQLQTPNSTLQTDINSALPTPHSPSALASHLERLMSEAEELKRSVPDFDLWRELDNSDFARLTNPASRVSVRAAYYAVHHDEINSRNMRAAAEAAAAETAKRLTGAYLSAQRRPQENGTAASAASLETVDWRTASRERLAAQRRAILAAAAKGETIYPKYE